MSRQIARITVICTLALTGCSTARMVTVTPNGGIVAIPSNTNSWPDYNRKHAEELIQAQCPGGYVVEREEEYVTGTTQYTHTTVEKEGDPLLSALHIAPVTENSHQSTSYRNQVEYRISFRKADSPPGSAPLSLPPTSGATQPVVVPSVGLIPQQPMPTTPSPVLSLPGVPNIKS